MKRLLRSVIDIDSAISQENLCGNFQKLITAKFEFPNPQDKVLYDYLRAYFQNRLEMPSKQTLVDYFTKVNDIETLERIEDIAAAPWYIRSNYSTLLQNLLEEQNKIRAVALLEESKQIITKGLILEGEKQQGVRAGLQHFAQNANNLIQPEYNARIRGNLREDGQAIWDEYTNAKANQGKNWGRFTGLNNIDKVCHGIKRGELWIHAAFIGELKTTFATTWAYNLVTRYRSNVFYASLEMKYDHIRRLIYAIHSTNLKYKQAGYKPLDYRRLRDGELTPEEEKFLQIIIEDFTTNPEYGSFDVWAPDEDVTIDDIRMEAELQHKQSEIGLLVIDHALLVEPRKKKRSKDFTIEANSVVRDAKKMALHFNHGESIPTLLLFQINRQGKDDADKSDGVYKVKALSYANEAERSADVITTSYLNDQLRTEKKTKFSCLKNRDNPLFEPFLATVNFDARRIFNMDSFSGSTGKGMGVEDHRTLIGDLWNV
jgi:hypothetical protein